MNELVEVAENNPVVEETADLSLMTVENSETELAPIAVIQGEKLHDLPRDLYIPPDALEVFLEMFEGPLDLLLYLIKKENLNILDIPIAEITRQYMEYIHVMKAIRFELAAEYLVMAAMLTEIKSRLLLPRPVVEGEEEADPRAELIRRLQEYEQFKNAAENIEKLPRLGRDTFQVMAKVVHETLQKPQPKADLPDLLRAFVDVMKRAELVAHHHVHLEPLSVRERMSIVLQALKPQEFTDFANLFDVKEGRLGIVVTFLAILELVRESLLEIVQTEPFAPIHVRAVGS